MSSYDLIIRNGIVVDGTGAKPYRADVGITADRVAAIGDLADATAERSIDAEGRFVAPGFIDPHTHFDAQIFYDPTCSDALQNGVTTILMSNCGIGLAPCRPDDRERYMLMLEAVEQIPHAVQKAILPWSWETGPEFIAALKKQKKALNLMAYAALGPIQMYAMGISESKSRRPTRGEIDDMKRMISETMDAGAIGISICYQGDNSGHVDSDGGPLPNDLLSHEDVCDISNVLAERNDGLIQLLAGRAGIDPTASLSEKLTALGRPVLHSFLSQAGEDGYALKKGLDWHDRVNADGKTLLSQTFSGRGWVEISLGTAVSFDMDPTWRELSFAGDDEARIAKLQDPTFVQRLKEAYNPQIFASNNGVIEELTLLSAPDAPEYERYIGKKLGPIAEERGMHIVDIYADINIKSRGRAAFKTMDLTASLDAIMQVWGHKNVLIGGSDGGAHLQSFVGAGWTTDLMVWLVRDSKRVTVEDAHYQMSNVTAQALGLSDRGVLAPGMAADILVYSLDELFFDTSKYYDADDLPAGGRRKRINSGGYRWILVNGEIAMDGKEYTESSSGLFLAPDKSLGGPPATGGKARPVAAAA